MSEEIKKHESMEGGDEEEEEEDDDEDPESRCPVYSGSENFTFITSRVPEVEVLPQEFAFEYVRPMRAAVNLLENPHGSVKLSQGNTTVITAVYGPSDIRISKELPHRAAVDVLFRPKVTGSGNTNTLLNLGFMDPMTSERAFEQTVVSILESVIHLNDHLQAGFNVIIHEVEDRGCLLSTVLNAISICLATAGCSIRCLFACVSILVCGDKIIIDPSNEQIDEIRKSNTPMAFASFVISNEIPRRVLHTRVQGTLPLPMLKKLNKLVCCSTVTSEIFKFIHDCVI